MGAALKFSDPRLQSQKKMSGVILVHAATTIRRVVTAMIFLHQTILPVVKNFTGMAILAVLILVIHFG